MDAEYLRAKIIAALDPVIEELAEEMAAMDADYAVLQADLAAE